MELGPRTGVPIRIPSCVKGHGCRHACISIARTARSCYVETKYDGERMQIHIDLSRPIHKQVQIFSKSRKDSTKKREEIIPYLSKRLGLTKNYKEGSGTHEG